MTQVDILEKVRKLRKERGLSQADMADALHVALKTYQNIECGVTRIDLDRLGQLAEVLGVGVYDLLGAGTAKTDGDKLVAEEKALYNKIILDKEAYIAQLEDSIRFYREILRENVAF